MKSNKELEHELLSPVRGGRIFEEVSHRIKELIFEGFYNVGDQLPTEAQLAETFGVGRQTVREALRMLEISGLITISRGAAGGPLITDTIFKKIGGLYMDAFRMNQITINELTSARFGIEKLIIDEVVERVDKALIEKLCHNITRAREKAMKNLRATQENMDFHRILAQTTGNQAYVIVLESLLAIQANFLIRIPPDVQTTNQVTDYHQQMVHAIENKDKEKTYRLLEDHMMEIETRLNLAAETNGTGAS